MVLRFLRFNAVGALGIAVQVCALWILAGPLRVHYIVATAIAIEISVLHNFFWHLHWTWARERDDRSHRHVLFRCAAFHAGNGLVSMLGSLALMPLLVGRLHVHYVLANLLAIACTGLLNFVLGDRMIFQRGDRPTK
jgi:putative flippase GtrA